MPREKDKKLSTNQNSKSPMRQDSFEMMKNKIQIHEILRYTIMMKN
jgi:hypothetical protein